jgi:hypothetical protein
VFSPNTVCTTPLLDAQGKLILSVVGETQKILIQIGPEGGAYASNSGSIVRVTIPYFQDPYNPIDDFIQFRQAQVIISSDSTEISFDGTYGKELGASQIIISPADYPVDAYASLTVNLNFGKNSDKGSGTMALDYQRLVFMKRMGNNWDSNNMYAPTMRSFTTADLDCTKLKNSRIQK